MPVDWYDTKVLDSSIGNYITVVRKDVNSDDWYLGSITNEQGRVLETPLYFLDEGRIYTAQIYRDGDDAHWDTNPYEMEVEEIEVTSRSIMKLRLMAGGGQAVRFTPVD